MRKSNYFPHSEKTDMIVYRTKNYGIFNIMNENRNINESHYKQLKKSIEEHGQYVPIIVDRKGNILEGQHRYYACKELGITILYIIRDLDIADVSEMNSKSRNWKMEDYLHNWSSRGYTEYRRLEEIKENNKDLELNVSNYIVLFGASDDPKNLEKFRNGEFKIFNEVRGKKVLGLYRKIKEYYHGNVNSAFLRAMGHIVNNPKISHDRFVDKLKNKPWEKVTGMTVRDYLRAGEDVYNFGVKKYYTSF